MKKKKKDIRIFLGRLILVLIGLGWLAFGLIPLTAGDLWVGLLIVGVGLVFLALARWSGKRPAWAFALALGLYMGLLVFKNSSEIGKEDINSLIFHGVLIFALLFAFLGARRVKREE